MTFTKDVLKIDPAIETERIVSALRRNVRQRMRRGGGVVGISGGIDSSVVLALGVRAFGRERVRAIIMPEKDSDPISEPLARELAERFGVSPILENITGVLEQFRCYERRDEAIRRVFADYRAEHGWKAKLVLQPDLLESGSLNLFSLTVITPDGREMTKRLGTSDVLQVVAASNLKQRTRMTTLYYHAELVNYAVLGTANRNEHAQGFFVKYGDGGVDIQTIGHLYKTQVYQLAEYLGVPEAIQKRTPTTDTYSAPCNQQEFFFRLPFETMDLLWYAQEKGISPGDAAHVMGLSEAQIEHAYGDFVRKARGTEYLRMQPVTIE